MRARLLLALLLFGCTKSTPSVPSVAPPSPTPTQIETSEPIATRPSRCAPIEHPTLPSSSMTFGAFVHALQVRIDAIDDDGVRAELAPIAARHLLDPNDANLLRDYKRLRTLFEATRDGGLWRIRWAITNEWPSSKLIWKRWTSTGFGASALSSPTATAECDEISSLTSFLAGRLGVKQVGLFYPTWNHTIVAWEPTIKTTTGKPARILLPTTQVFLGCDDAIDVTSFSPKAQKNVYAYVAADVSDAATIPAETAAFLLGQIDRYASASRDVLALIRLHRALRLDSSVGTCAKTRRTLSDASATKLRCEDEEALRHYWTTELRREPEDDPRRILEQLASPG